MTKRKRRHVESGELHRRGERRVLLPNETAPGAAQLVVPHQYVDTVIVGVCHACGARFGPGQEEEWQRHMRPCYLQHEGEVRAEREERKKRLAIFQEESWDPELARHFRKVGDRMLREGRLTMHPNERANG